jgi:uncharacterized integral membrane protein
MSKLQFGGFHEWLRLYDKHPSACSRGRAFIQGLLHTFALGRGSIPLKAKARRTNPASKSSEFATTIRCEQAVGQPKRCQSPMSTNARKFRIAAIFAVIVLVLLVIWQNSEMTTVKLLMISAELPLMLWLGLFLLTGVLLGIALMWSDRRRH